jgi:hypothetical protein
MMGIQIGAAILMISLIGWLAHSWKVQIETNYSYKLEAELSKAAKNYQEQTAKATLEIANNKHKIEITALEEHNISNRKIRELTQNLERLAYEKPFKTANLYELRLKRILCKIATNKSSEARASCDRFEVAPENYAPRFASFITITPKVAEQYKEFCEEGKLDYCNYSMMSLTNNGASDLLYDLNTILFYIERLNAGEDARIEALKFLRDFKMTISNK